MFDDNEEFPQVPEGRVLPFDNDEDRFHGYWECVLTDIIAETGRVVRQSDEMAEIVSMYYNSQVHPSQAAHEIIARMGWSSQAANGG